MTYDRYQYQRHIFFIALGFLSLFLQQEVQGAILRPHIQVDTPTIRLGDVFEDVGKKADVQISVAPAPGKSLILRSAQLRQIAKTQNIEWRPYTRYDHTKVVRSSEVIQMEALLDRLHQALSAEMPQEDFKVALDGRDIKIHVAKSPEPEISIKNLSLNTQRTGFTAHIQVAQSGKTLFSEKINGRIVPLISIPVLIRAVQPSEMIRAEDIQFISVESHAVKSGTILEEKDLIGALPRRQALRSSVPLHKSDVKVATPVKRGDHVTMHAKSSALTLSARGKALDGGKTGDTIRVVNLDSTKVLEATIVGPKAVEILLPSLER